MLAKIRSKFKEMTKVCSHVSDIYAYGAVLYELMARKLPFHEFKDDKEIKQLILDGKRPVLAQDEFPEYNDLLGACLAANPGDRIPRFSDIMARLKKIGKEHGRK